MNLPETSNNEFSGIWDANQKPEPVIASAYALKDEQILPGTQPLKRKHWGVIDVIINFLVMFGVQIVISIVAVAALLATMGDGFLTTESADITTNPYILISSSLGMYLVWIVGMKIVTKFKGQNSFKKDFKLSFKKRDILYGIGTAAFGFFLLNGLSWLLGDVFGLDMAGSDNGAGLSAQTGIWFVIIAIGIASIAGPISEELFFRGFLMHAVQNTFGNRAFLASQRKPADSFAVKSTQWWNKHKVAVSVIISSIIFALMHFQGVETFGQSFVLIGTGVLGACFALLVVKTGRLGPAIIAHVVYNGSVMLLTLI